MYYQKNYNTVKDLGGISAGTEEFGGILAGTEVVLEVSRLGRKIPKTDVFDLLKLILKMCF